MKDLRILFVSSGTRDEGIGSLIMDQGESIKAQGIGIEYFTIKSKGFSGYLRNIFKLRNHLKKNQYDIIHAHYGLSGIVAILANNKHNKLVISFMGTDLLGIVAPDGKITIKGKLLVILIHKFVKYADYVIVKSQAMADKIAFKNKSVIPNGIDLKLFYPIERSFALQKLGWDERFHHLLFMSDPERPEKNYILLESGQRRGRRKMPQHVIVKLPLKVAAQALQELEHQFSPSVRREKQDPSVACELVRIEGNLALGVG